MFNVSVTLNYEVPRDDIETLLDMAGYGIAYWATSAEIKDNYYIVTWEEDPGVVVTRKVHFGSLVEVLALIATGTTQSAYDDYARSYFTEGLDAGVFDASLADHVVQWALFGEIVFG